MTGMMATFQSQDSFVAALKTLRQKGYKHLDTATGQEIEGLEDLLGKTERASIYSKMGLTGAVFGIAAGWLMQWFASADQTPLNIGGRPLNSWPSFVPIIYILMILCSALSLTATFIFDLRLPWPSHPLFHTSLDLSSGNFAILISVKDPLFDSEKIRGLFQQLQAVRIEEVP